MKLLAKLQNSVDFWFLLIAFFFFFLLRLPSFFEPYWYGDEGVYEVLGFAMRHGRLLYKDIWDNKPPLLYVVYAIFNGNQMYVRIFNSVIGLGAVICLFFIAKKLFVRKSSIFAATGFFALFFGLPLIEGNIANAENFMLLPIFGAMLLVLKALENKKNEILKLFFAGFLLGFAFLFKVVSVFDLGTIYIVFLISEFNNHFNFFEILKRYFFLTLGFILPIITTIGFFANQHILSIFLQSAFFSNVGYVGYGNQFSLPIIGTIPQGFLLIKLLILFLFLLTIFLFRKKMSFAQIFIFTWLGFSVFNAFFSQRPYTHYVLVLLGSLSLLFGLLWERNKNLFNAILLVGIVLLVAKNFWFFGKIPGYYTNFAGFLMGTRNVNQYQSFFDQGVPRDYAIADFLKKNVGKNQTVFLWTNSAQIYYLSNLLPIGRFTVAYHMTLTPANLNETIMDLNRTKPNFLVILPNASLFPFRITDYKLAVTIGEGLIYERISK